MIETGIVKEVFENKAKISIQKHSACKKCGVCKYDAESKMLTAEAVNNIGAKEGDEVEIAMDFDVLMSASLIAYIIPIIMFIIGCVLGFYLISPANPILSFIVGLIFIAITYLIIRMFDKRGKFKKKYSMQITKIIKNS
ncbi:MAG: SoxR reducing system RseC family protein [Eubacteriaceae bacterium]|nr:SoxR reducing system RseC family protein [Eubacteriaceae bacterium]